MEEIGKYVVDEDDIAYEYELQCTPQNMITWRRYLNSWISQDSDKRPVRHIVWLYERFCAQFKNDVDIWTEYIRWLLGKCGKDVDYKTIYSIFLRCLENFANGCDELCMLFLEFSISQYDLKAIREALNISLTKVPKQSHARIWETVLTFISQTLAPLTSSNGSEYEDEMEELSILIYRSLFASDSEIETSVEVDLWSSQILRRYLEVCPRGRLNDVLISLAETGDYKSICSAYQRTLGNGDDFLPTATIPFSIHIHYLDALENLHEREKYDQFINRLGDVFPQKSVELAIKLAKFYIRTSQNERAGDLLRSSLERTLTARDFSLIYNMLLNYEKAFIETVLQELKSNISLQPDVSWQQCLEFHMSCLENLIETQKLRLNDLKIRQNPNMVRNWSERVSLFATAEEKCNVFSQAILMIDPTRVKIPGSFGKLWCDYAELYWGAGDYDYAREVWDRSLRVPFPFLDDLEGIWLSWVEHELEQNGVEDGIKLLETALKVPENPDLVLDNFRQANKKVPAQATVFSSLKLWSLYLDLVESLCIGSPEYVDKTVTTYEQVIALKVATPLIFINYAHFLQEHKEKLESFQIYERAIGYFPPETQIEIWNLYLAESTDKETPLSKEHIRDLFDQALENLVSSGIDCKDIFLLYSDFEEECGMPSRSVEILLQGCRETQNLENKITLWQLCISKTKQLLGNEESRKLYEECIQSLPNSRVIKFVIDFAETESNLGEVERAREVLKYGARMLPPGRNALLWESWDEFELKHGDKESYKDMLKLKRKLEKDMRIESEVESQLEGNIAFVAASKTNNAINPEEIDLNI